MTYEVTIKERGYGPEPYAIADAVVKIGQKAIVELNGISLRLSGTDRNQLEDLWRGSADSRNLSHSISRRVFRS